MGVVMNMNLRRLNEEQLWDLYAREVELASKIKDEIKRRLSVPKSKVIRSRKFKRGY